MAPELFRLANPIAFAAACICFALARYCGIGGWITASLLGGLGGLVIFDRTSAPVERLQFILLISLAAILLFRWKAHVWSFALAGALVMSLAAVLVGWSGQRHYASFVDRAPLISLADRLAYETRPEVASQTRYVVGVPAEDLEKLDAVYSERDHGWQHGQRRTRVLRLIHATWVEQFINAEGFFGERRMRRISPGDAVQVEPAPLVPFPNPRALLGGSPGAAFQPVATVPPLVPPRSWSEPFHFTALSWFAASDDCGYIVDRHHVAGFRGHSLGQLPQGPNQPPRQTNPYWFPLRVELVSLLKHDEPSVYVSESLPNMNELRDAPVRPLDDFERWGLPRLDVEGDIAAAGVGEHVRMLGAIRAARQCLVCHDVAHGALLGAFSYELLAEGPRTADHP